MDVELEDWATLNTNMLHGYNNKSVGMWEGYYFSINKKTKQRLDANLASK